MKKLFLLMGAIGMIVFVTSCERQQLASLDNSTVTPSGQKKVSWGVCCTFYVGPGDCSSPKTNCFDEVVIHGRAAYAGLVDVANGGAEEVSDYFNGADWKGVFPDLDGDEGDNAANIEYLHKLQSGDYDMIIHNQEGSTITHFLCGRGDVTTENAEFDLPVDTKDMK